MQSKQLPRQYLGWRKWREIVQIWSLVIPGFAGILITVVSFFLPFFKDYVTGLLLFLFSILLIAIGLERYDAIGEERKEVQRRHEEVIQAITRIQNMVEQDDRAIEKDIAMIHQLVTSSIPSQILMNPKQIYREYIELVEGCKGTEVLLATSLGSVLHEEESDYDNYLEALAKKIGETQQQKVGMLYRVVMGFQLNKKGEPPIEKQAGIRRRRELFKKYGVPNRMQIRYLETPWSLDLFIVGNEHMFIGFPSFAGNREIRLALRVTDKDFASATSGVHRAGKKMRMGRYGVWSSSSSGRRYTNCIKRVCSGD